MIVGAIHGTDPQYGVAVFKGQRAHRALVALFGLPNVAPTPDETRRLGALACISTRRVVFVDDWNDGQPRAVWLPEPSCGRERGAF